MNFKKKVSLQKKLSISRKENINRVKKTVKKRLAALPSAFVDRRFSACSPSYRGQNHDRSRPSYKNRRIGPTCGQHWSTGYSISFWLNCFLSKLVDISFQLSLLLHCTVKKKRRGDLWHSRRPKGMKCFQPGLSLSFPLYQNNTKNTF